MVPALHTWRSSTLEVMDEHFDQIEPSRDLPKPKTPLGKVVLVNLGILFLSILVTLYNTGGVWDIVLSALMFIGQGGVNLFLGLLLMLGEPYKQVGKAMVIIGLIIIPIGIVFFLSFLSRSH